MSPTARTRRKTADPSGKVIANAAIVDAEALRKLGEVLRAHAAELERLRATLGRALNCAPLRVRRGLEEVDDPRVVAIRRALAYAVEQINALALPRPTDHADDVLRAFGMKRGEVAKALGVTDGAVKRRRSRRGRPAQRA